VETGGNPWSCLDHDGDGACLPDGVVEVCHYRPLPFSPSRSQVKTFGFGRAAATLRRRLPPWRRSLGEGGVPGSVLACSWRWLLEKVTAVWCWAARPVLLICASPPSAWLPTAGRRPRLGEGGRAPLCI
jgi:hypothetical protein